MFWDGGFGARASHLMEPELEQRNARAPPVQNPSKMVVPFAVKNKCATADSTPGTNVLSPAETHCIWGPWCQNTREFWDGGFGATVSHLMVPELEQRSATPARSAGRKMSLFPYFLAKSEKSVTGVTWVRTSFLLKVGATGVPPPNESFFEQLGDQRFRI